MRFKICCSVCNVEEDLGEGTAKAAQTALAAKKSGGWDRCTCKPQNKIKWSSKSIRDEAGPPPQPVTPDAGVRGDIVVSGLIGHSLTVQVPSDEPGGQVGMDFVVYTGARALGVASSVVLMAHGRQCETTPLRGYGGGDRDFNLALAYACPPGHSLYRFAAYPKAAAAVRLLKAKRGCFVTPSPNALLGHHTSQELAGVEQELLAACIKEVVADELDCDFAIMVGYDVRASPVVASIAMNDAKIPFRFVGEALKTWGYDSVLLLACRSPWNGDPQILGMLGSGRTHDRFDALYNAIAPVSEI